MKISRPGTLNRKAFQELRPGEVFELPDDSYKLGSVYAKDDEGKAVRLDAGTRVNVAPTRTVILLNAELVIHE